MARHARPRQDASSGTTISTAVSSSVTLGQGVYGDTLTITAAGSVIPSVAGATGIAGTGPGVALYNLGVVSGGGGGPADGGVGGTGVSLIAAYADNSGVISGGAGSITGATGGAGGVGMILAGGLINNSGTIDGGTGGDGQGPSPAAGTGGAGVSLDTGTLVNTGSIYGGAAGFNSFPPGDGGAGVSMTGGTLANSGTLVGGLGGGTGVLATNSVVENSLGFIAGGSGGYPDGAGGIGVSLDGGTLVNAAAIYGGYGGANGRSLGGPGGAGVAISDGTVTNTGTIGGGAGGRLHSGPGGGGAGVVMSGGTLSNQGAISAGNAGYLFGLNQGGAGGTGVDLSGGGVLSNTGTITGGIGAGFFPSGAGVAIGGASLTNDGTIVGGAGEFGKLSFRGAGAAGAYLDGGTLTNAGTISSGYGGRQSNGTHYTDAVQFGSLAGTLVVDPGAVFIGDVVANAAAADVLELAGMSAGTLSGFGTEFSNFSTLDFAAGAAWSVGGSASALATGQVIDGFASGDTIVLDNFVETGSLYVSGTGLELDSASGAATLDITGSFTTQSFGISTDGTSTTIELCYLRGTRILTPTGEVPIETLRIGDRVVTRFGGIQTVRWIGCQRHRRTMRSDPADLPVRIRAGALGEHLPARDLFVSPRHSMLLGDVLVLASTLVNDITITQELPAATQADLTYFQIELAAHDCIIAEGTWSETFGDGPGMRDAFDNAADFYRRYPDAVPPESLALCAARPEQGAGLQAALRPVAMRAASRVTPGPFEGCIDGVIGQCRVEGWALDLAHPRLPVLLDVLLNGERIGSTLACAFRDDLLKAGKGNGRCAFAFMLPRRLAPAAFGAIAVQRAADGAALPASDAWRRARKAA